ncbi:MAG: cytochrome b/b6 domain-containing protein [Deltaproteobacteria bacterium]|nr:cytochrome b/b6 domain-containing protein [Deltaproteobacteria bacterium]
MSKNMVYMYTPWERIWHWTQAGSILTLLASGLVVHMPRTFSFIPFDAAVDVHNAVAILLLVNAVFGFTYYVISGSIKQYFPRHLGDHLRDFYAQALYYGYGIFMGAPHPVQKTAERRFNPIQMTTYASVMMGLLPMQLATGVALWLAPYFPETLGAPGAIGVLALLHTVGAWSFGAFVLGHVYMTTTGHTVMQNIVTMITGWEEEEHHDDHKEVQA